MKFESEDIVFTPITSLLSVVIDNRGRTCPTAEEGIPLIATNCIGNENLYPVKKNIRYISIETYNTWFRGHPEPGDIIFVNKGTPGRVCLVPDPIDFCIAQDMVSLRVNEHINNLYLLAAIRAPQVQNQIQQMQVGTMIPHFKKGDFEKLLIPMRDMPIQRAIGRIYFELSQKIDVNERASKTLEDIAQTIFKSWFIDFDPVKSKMAGEKPAGMDSATAALFPDSLQESEVGLIPNSWQVQHLGDLVTPKKGKTITKATCVDGEVPVVAGGLQPAYFHNTANALQPVITVSASGANAGYVRLYLKDIWASDCSYVNSEITQTVHFWYLFLSRNQEFIYGMQQGAAQPHIYPSDLMRLKLSYPNSIDVVMKFEEAVTPLFLEIGALERQNESLKSLRDSLLPRLISGELQIPEEMLAS